MKLNIGWDKKHSYWLCEKNAKAKYNDFYNGNNPIEITQILINMINNGNQD